MSKSGTSNPGLTGKLGGKRGESQQVIEANSRLLSEILVELKINNKILNEVHDSYVNEQDIERK